MKVAGKVIVVTSGGNGIGQQVVLALLAKDAEVAAVDISEVALGITEQRSNLSSKLSTHSLDITDRTRVEALVAGVIAHHGRVDGLINVAGIIQPFVRINDLPYSAIEKVMNVNFWGSLYMVKSFLPELLKRPEGHVVNVSSMGAYAPVPGQSIYGASKAAVKLMSEGLFAELIDTNVRVTVVFPGATATDISVNSGVVMAGLAADSSQFKMLSPKIAADQILQGMENDAYHVFTGSDAKTMDRLARYLPNRVVNIIYKQMKSLLPPSSLF